jgi:hypothetical protein
MKTLKVMALFIGIYALLCMPAYFSPQYADSPMGVLIAIPFLSVYVFHSIGIPGLLEHSGACGWGWCAPTAFGWIFIVSVWLLAAWMVARLVVMLRRNS